MDPLEILGLTVVGAVILFFILREAMLWYFKINERLELQRLQVEHLKRIADKLDPEGIKLHDAEPVKIEA